MSRWIRLDCEYFDHDFFADEPFTEREAFQWLIINAAWKDTSHRVKYELLPVPRGSLYCTQRELSKVWKWSTTKVRNYLALLVSQNMIERSEKTQKTLVSICNYSKFQDVQTTEKTQQKHDSTTTKTQQKHNKNTKDTNNTIIPISSSLHSEDNTNPLSLSEPKISPRKKAAPKSTISETWEPDQSCIDKAYSIGMDRSVIEVEAENFRNHHFNKQSKMVNWSLAWNTWCNNWKKFQANKPQSFKAKSSKPSEFDMLDDLADKIEARGVIQ